MAVETRLKSIKCVAKTDRGKKRTDNQDSYGIVERHNFRFYMVADGMGGARAGGVASDIAVTVITKELTAMGELTALSVRRAILRANQEIRKVALERPECRGMGTTICGLGFTDTKTLICNVGDSRLYRSRGGFLTCLTQDHTVAAELVKSGVMSQAESEVSPVAHILTRSLGVDTSVEVDVHVLDGIPDSNDRFLLCSDGLYGMLSESHINALFSNTPISMAAEALTRAANDAGGNDNITVLALSLETHSVDVAKESVLDTQQLHVKPELVPMPPKSILDRPLSVRTALMGGGLGLVFSLLFFSQSPLRTQQVLASEAVEQRSAGETRQAESSRKNILKPTAGGHKSFVKQGRAQMSEVGYAGQLTDSLATWYRIKAHLRQSRINEVQEFLRSHGIDPKSPSAVLKRQVEREIAKILSALAVLEADSEVDNIDGVVLP